MFALVAAGAAAGAQPTPPCVNPGGTGGCSATISAAVAAAAPGSTIQVAPGIYKESVTITQGISLMGAGPGMSIIDATGLSVGIFINGMAAAPSDGIGGVSISGFTIKNANFEGILVANALGVTISGNTVVNNDKSLMPGANATCPGLPAFETNEGEDCGEGIHLTGVDHSIISGNIIENNSGGILVSDETGPTHDNLITGNTVADNAYDCGITMASHAAAPSLNAKVSFGVYHNTIARNAVSHNGYLGQGAGVGIFAPGPGATASLNTVIGNDITDNGLGGVTMHNHAAPGVGKVPAQAPGVNLSDNSIIGNHISGNAADVDDPTTPGPTGISITSFALVGGTVIAENVFDTEVADIVFNAPTGTIEAHLNDFGGQAIAIDNEGSGGVDAAQNFWSCQAGPNAPGCSTTMGPYIFANSWLPGPQNGQRGPHGR